jgi:SNF2 family DNA or RNA helicase
MNSKSAGRRSADGRTLESSIAEVRNGSVRVLIGSTQKMGTGTNVQKRLVALHHLDAPWKPAEVEQRDGRILRQGNENEEVAVYRYVAEGSFDAYMWQALETKARFIGHNVAEPVM